MEGKPTSVSNSCTKLPELFTKFHTIAANCSTPRDWPSSGTAVVSLEKDEAVDVVREFVVWSASICPLVLRMAPVARSRTMLAFTPGFFDRRPSFSSRGSCPFAYP